jgi:predicted aconitase with swiveling domain
MSGVRVLARPMIQGRASGTAVVSRKAFTFAHGVDPTTGKVTDVHSDVKGEGVRGRILFYPFGKGSTTASAWFLETVRLGNGPAAVVTGSTDLSIVIGSVLARSVYAKVIPVLSSFPREAFDSVKTGDEVEVDGTTGDIVISER